MNASAFLDWLNGLRSDSGKIAFIVSYVGHIVAGVRQADALIIGIQEPAESQEALIGIGFRMLDALSKPGAESKDELGEGASRGSTAMTFQLGGYHGRAELYLRATESATARIAFLL